MSREEQQQRKTQEQEEEEALAAALEASRQDSGGFNPSSAHAPGKSRGSADDDDHSDEDDLARAIRESQMHQEPKGNDSDDILEEAELINRAIRESQLLEDERRRLDQQEEQELETALRESQKVYEVFHATGDDAFERTLQQSLWEAKLMMDDEGEAISDSKWKAIMSAYDEVDDDEEGEDEDEEQDQTRGRASSSGSGAAVASSSRPPPAAASGSGSRGATGSSTAAASSSSHATSSTAAAASSGGPGPSVGSNFDLQGWFRRRADELKVDFEKDVLWFVLSELEDRQLDDQEAVKMWLGLSEDDKVPAALSSLIREFAQHKRQMKK